MFGGTVGVRQSLVCLGLDGLTLSLLCLYCVDNHLRCSPVIVFLLHVLSPLKQNLNKAFPVFDGKYCPVFSSKLIENVFLGMYFSSRINNF